MLPLEKILFIYLIIHAVICLLIWLGMRLQILRISEQMMPMVFLVPIAGVLTAAAAEILTRTNKHGSRDITLEDPHLEFADLRLHKIDRDQNLSEVVPIQEALRVNDAQTRRRLILDIIRQDPKDYIFQLREACSDTDLEVSHYASTAIMEIQREYEISTQQAEREYAQDPENITKLGKSIQHMQRYIESGLIDESIIHAYRQRFALLLSKKMELSPEDMSIRITASDNYLELKNLTEAKALADLLTERWPNRESVWLQKLKVSYVMQDTEGIRDTLCQIKERNVYLTPEGKSIIRFWQYNNTEGE